MFVILGQEALGRGAEKALSHHSLTMKAVFQISKIFSQRYPSTRILLPGSCGRKSVGTREHSLHYVNMW